MEFGKKTDRLKYLEDKFDDLLYVISDTYGNVLKDELISRLDLTIEEFNSEMSNLFESLKNKEIERQSLLNKHKDNVESEIENENKNLTDWEEKLKQIEESK
tara:strand:+ start:127 stop:432 length:306 start_codon:yes stop_codon:yes gene_type:complete